MRFDSLLLVIAFATLSACSVNNRSNPHHSPTKTVESIGERKRRASVAVKSFYLTLWDRTYLYSPNKDISSLKPYLDSDLYKILKDFRSFILKNVVNSQYKLLLPSRVANFDYFYLGRVSPSSFSIVRVIKTDVGFDVEVKAAWTSYIAAKIGNPEKVNFTVYVTDNDEYRISDVKFTSFEDIFTLKEFIARQKQGISDDIRAEQRATQNAAEQDAAANP